MMRLLPLPSYAPELNPGEHGWDELGEKHFHNFVISWNYKLLHMINQLLLLSELYVFSR